MSWVLQGTLWPMNEGRSGFNIAYCRRVQELREARGMTQEQMATALEIPLDRYKKYEIRSPLPPHLIERFSVIVGRDISYVVTGKMMNRRRGPLAPPHPEYGDLKRG